MSSRSVKNRGLSVGIDIGGTFTDVILMNAQGAELAQYKVHTTPENLESCFITGLSRASEDLPPQAISRILHASTVATNTVLEEKGARTALVLTKGFRDILEIARQRRPSLYDLKAEKANPLVPRRLCFEVEERIDADGRVVTALTDRELKRLAKELKVVNVESIVVALLFSYLNPEHEQRIKKELSKLLPDRVIVASADVIPEFREFERTSTAVLVGYLKPIFQRYTKDLARELANLKHDTNKLLIMNSAGGLMSPEAARDKPHTIVESGPAAGVIAVAALAQEMGEPNLLSFDMGGTTAKASLIENGTYRTTTEYEIGAGTHQSLAVRFTGYPIKAPMIDLTECSAGGGSIASVDGLGVLKVGPGSAGAVPGPVCYGLGGDEPTVTDANVALGRINPDYFVGGESILDRAAAEKAIATRIAKPLGLSMMEAAAGITAVVNAHMTRILRVVSISRGLDPRDFSLVAFGGAGPLHAADLATDMGIPRVIVPESPGLFSALGLLWADLRSDFSSTVRLNLLAVNGESIARQVARLETDAQAWLGNEKVPGRRRRLERSADMRYPMQNYEINVTLPGGAINQKWLARARESFHVAHERLYGYCDRDEDVQLVNLRVAAIGRTDRANPPKIPKGGRDPKRALKAKRPVHFQEVGDFVTTRIYERDRLFAGNKFAGPAVIEEADSTVIVPPSYTVEIDPHGRIIMSAKKQGSRRKTG
jgi:N-methylhydantoinase A